MKLFNIFIVASLCTMQRITSAQAPEDSTTNSPKVSVVCNEYKVFTKDDCIESIEADFETDLQLLNPNLDLNIPLEVGTALCVRGTVEDTGTPGIRGRHHLAIGKRPSNVVEYTTTPGQDNCLSIMEKARPALSIATFVELNPQVNCRDLETDAVMIYLPPGTTMSRSAESRSLFRKDTKQDCIVGQWGDWGACSPDNTQKRSRNVYQEAGGEGEPCPATHESRECEGGRALETDENDHRVLLEPNQCPAGYDGCSVPDGIQYYHLFVPACNLHDICYSCNLHPGWEFASKEYCDGIFHLTMIAQCNSHWDPVCNPLICLTALLRQTYTLLVFSLVVTLIITRILPMDSWRMDALCGLILRRLTMPMVLASCLNGLDAPAKGPAVSTGEVAMTHRLFNVTFI